MLEAQVNSGTTALMYAAEEVMKGTVRAVAEVW